MRHVSILAPLLAPHLVGGRYLQRYAQLRSLAGKVQGKWPAAGLQCAKVRTASGK